MESKQTTCKANMCAQCRHAECVEGTSPKMYTCKNTASKHYNETHRGQFACQDGFKHFKMKYKFASFKILD